MQPIAQGPCLPFQYFDEAIQNINAKVNAIIDNLNNVANAAPVVNAANNANNAINAINAQANPVQMLVEDPSFEQVQPEVVNQEFLDVEHNYFANERQVFSEYFNHLDKMLAAHHSLKLYAQNAHVMRQTPAELHIYIAE
jgi:hypothetical protein